jgi:hypothetical protein
MRQWSGDQGQDANCGEVKRTFDLEDAPTRLATGIRWNGIGCAYHGYLIGGARHRVESAAAPGRVRQRIIGRQPANREVVLQQEQVELGHAFTLARRR